jgi:hypothetical protein
MLATVAVLALIAFVDPPERKEPPTKEELAAITERGRSLAAYDAAAWHASDALQVKPPKEGSVVQYVARKTDKGWIVVFGRMNQAQDKFLIAYEAKQGEKPEQFDVKGFDPPEPETGFFLSAARAMDLALKDFTETFEGENRPYNIAVLPAEKDKFWVYLVPAPTKQGVWPLGGDVRYLVSSDGRKILVKRQLHKSVIEIERPKDENQKQDAGVHTHILDETPEDTDVFHVLTRKPAVPEIVATKRFVFQVGEDGAISYLGKAEELFKEK